MDERDELSLAGMTINERPFHVGILDQWDAAARRPCEKAHPMIGER